MSTKLGQRVLPLMYVYARRAQQFLLILTLRPLVDANVVEDGVPALVVVVVTAFVVVVVAVVVALVVVVKVVEPAPMVSCQQHPPSLLF